MTRDLTDIQGTLVRADRAAMPNIGKPAMSSTVGIVVPIFALRHRRIGGVESAVYNFCKGLYDNGVALTLAYSNEDHLSAEFRAWIESFRGGLNIVRRPGLRGPVPVRFFEEMLFANTFRTREFVLYPNYFLPPRLARNQPRTGVILHDCQHRLFPHFYTPAKRAWLDLCYRRSLQQADCVFLVSEHEKSMIVRHFGDGHADKCKVIHNAIDWDRFAGGEVGEPIAVAGQRPYVLSVSHQFPHKNTETLIRAFRIVASRVADIHLYLVGVPSRAALRACDAELSPDVRARVKFFGFVSDAELGHLYRKAALFALPSLYEGFGMPAVEALGHGLPTIVSACAALPEVTCGQATYITSPLSENEWATAMLAQLRGPGAADPGSPGATAIREKYAPMNVASRICDIVSTLA